MSTPTGATRPLLDVAGLRVPYGGVVAVSDVDLQIARGHRLGLIGPNGAGKTSMVDALTGYTRPAAGSVAFDGHDISRLRPYRRARLGLARTFQSVELFDDLTVDENLLVASEHVSVGSALRDLFLPAPPAGPDQRRLGDRRMRPRGRRRPLPVARSRWASASWSASAGRWRGSPGSSCSTSPPPGSTPTRASSSAAACARCPRSTA